MDPSGEQVRAFGDDARRRRQAMGMSAAAVAGAMTASLGRPVKRQSVEAWERGEYGPKDVETAAALDTALSAGGELAGLLLTEVGGSLPDRVTRIEETLARQEAQLDEILAILRAGRRPRRASP